MKINQDFVNANFEVIWTTSISDGVPLPHLLMNNTPLEYLLTEEYMEEFISKLPKKKREKLEDEYIKRRLLEIELFNKYSNLKDKIKQMDKYVEEELKSFIKSYPQFKQIIGV